MIRPIDLGPCGGYAEDGDPARVVVALPGGMLGAMPSRAFPLYALVARGWSAVQIWDEWRGRNGDADGMSDHSVGTGGDPLVLPANLTVVVRRVDAFAASLA